MYKIPTDFDFLQLYLNDHECEIIASRTFEENPNRVVFSLLKNINKDVCT